MEKKTKSDYIDALLYAMQLKKQPKQNWKFIPLKGVGDNNGFWEVEVSTLPQDNK